jgi:hypothetical protein
MVTARPGLVARGVLPTGKHSGVSVAVSVSERALPTVALAVADDGGGSSSSSSGTEALVWRCGVCRKAYKHGYCLTKHAWEHHALWPLTKGMCPSKHQQVQLLEAAAVLVALRTCLS